jgi:hypothetical protein
VAGEGGGGCCFDGGGDVGGEVEGAVFEEDVGGEVRAIFR